MSDEHAAIFNMGVAIRRLLILLKDRDASAVRFAKEALKAGDAILEREAAAAPTAGKQG